ncbi:hypothetical protein BGZ76_003040 [Entomortierella beljakovae]|nr:hypothetical protein BGZ76_003040 [Entomortierella beljakovae]
MNATSIALSSQDILYQILSFNQLTQSELYSCCLVNTEWAAAGLILLWRYPKCRSAHTFRLLLDTLRHEDDQSAPIGATIGSYNTQKNTAAKRSATMRNKSSTPSAFQLPTSGSLASLLPTIYPPFRERKGYGIPFHGQKLHHRAQFIREIDFKSLIGAISNHHFEILARSTKIGFRALDLRTVQLPFSTHLLSILQNSRSLRKLCLSKMHIPVEGIVYLEQCFSTLAELRYDFPDTMCDNELGLILRHCTQLRILEIRGEYITDDSLSWIAKSCLELETLVIEAPLMTDSVVIQIATACTRLNSWSLIDCAYQKIDHIRIQLYSSNILIYPTTLETTGGVTSGVCKPDHERIYAGDTDEMQPSSGTQIMALQELKSGNIYRSKFSLREFGRIGFHGQVYKDF